MKYDDLEKTKELFEIDEDVPTPIENIEMEGISKDTVTDEFTLGLTDKEASIINKNIKEKEEKSSKKSKKEKKEKKSIKEKWNELTKKQKVLTISLIVLILIVIITFTLMLVLKKDDKKTIDEPNKPNEPIVELEEENYIYKDGSLILIDKDKNELGIYECKNKDENLCLVAYFSSEDEFNGPKYLYEDESTIERRSHIYNDNYVFIKDNNSESSSSIILYNIKEEKEEGIYSLVKGFKDSNYVIVKDSSNKYGALEITNEGPIEKIKISYDYLGMINSDSKVVAKTNNKYFIYSKDGKLESKGLSYPIKNYNNNYIVIDNNGEALYDYKSKQVIEGTYDYISLLDDYVGLVKDNKLYIRDYNNNKYNEEGIELFNSYYNELNIYNEEKVLTNKKYSYKINIIENNIDITYVNKNDKEKNISLSINEGKLSSKFANLNYIDGKLYFYKEENKKTLLGTYSCTNKNTIESDTNTLNSCYIASTKDNTGWLPIINERYVFIIDSLDKNNKTIMLYDLKNNKTLSRYANVDLGVEVKENKITFISNNNLYVIAENKSNKYGVIKVEDDVKSVIPFNYKNISKLKDYFMAETSGNTYLLINNTGNKESEEFGSKIVDYSGKYLKTEDNKVYGFDRTEISKEEFLYIELKDDYYVVINKDKKLDIKKYNDTSFKLRNPIDIGDTTDYSNAFEVSKSTSNYIIKIKSTGSTINVPLTGDNTTSTAPEGNE